MKANTLTQFKYACKAYLSSLSIGQLRSYGRNIGVAKSTTMKKEDLIRSIIAILSEEAAPVARSRKGAPVKNEYVEPEIPKRIEEMRIQHLSGTSAPVYYSPIEIEGENETARRIAEFKQNCTHVMRVEDGELAEKYDLRRRMEKPVLRGQLETLNGVSLLLALNCSDPDAKIIIPVELIHQYDLREGDIISCYVNKSHTAYVAYEILTINEMDVKNVRRYKFEDCAACYPSQRIALYDAEKTNALGMKYLHWLLPIGRGQRGCLISSPKAGKTNLLYDIAFHAMQLNQKLTTMVLLVDQSPENVTKFHKIIRKDNLVYTTYDDEPDRQVFAADFLLKRAKRYAECGNDVLLIVDSFTALARAFNDTDASVGGKTFQGGLESKTLQYIKKYFGTARCLENAGSITMIGAISNNTGNPADDLIASELMAVDNWEIQLSDALATKRIYPAIDFMHSQVKQGDYLFTEQEAEFDAYVRNNYMQNHDMQDLREALMISKTYEDFVQAIKK